MSASLVFMMGDLQRAAENFRISLELDPRRSAYSNTGTMYYYAGDYAEAEQMFARAAEQTDNDYRLWGNLADAQRLTQYNNQEVKSWPT
jgi:Flp pilus assembly protein TadD